MSLDSHNRKKALDFFNRENYSEALSLLMGEDIDPAEDSELSYLLGLTCLRLEDYQTAEHYLRNVLEMDTSLSKIYQTRLLLGFLYIQTGFYSTAEYHMSRLIDEGYQAPQIYSLMGYAAWAQGLSDESREYYEKALDLDSSNSNVLNSLGFLMAEKGENLEKAVLYCQKAVAANPLNGNYLDSLGWALYKKGDREQARIYLEKALEYNPSAEIRKHWELVQND